MRSDDKPRPKAAWVNGICKTCSAYTHSCKCEHPNSELVRSLFAAPREGVGSTAGPATNGEPAAAAPVSHERQSIEVCNTHDYAGVGPCPKCSAPSSIGTCSEETLKKALRPALEKIFDNLDDMPMGQAVQILVDSLRDLETTPSAILGNANKMLCPYCNPLTAADRLRNIAESIGMTYEELLAKFGTSDDGDVTP